MRSKIYWIVIGVLGLAALFFLPSLLMGRSWPGFYGGIMGPGMMGGVGYFNPLSFFGMALMWLIPLSIVVLVVLGIVGLVKGLNSGNWQNSGSSMPTRPCPNCSRTVQADWTTCPYCGKPL